MEGMKESGNMTNYTFIPSVDRRQSFIRPRAGQWVHVASPPSSSMAHKNAQARCGTGESDSIFIPLKLKRHQSICAGLDTHRKVGKTRRTLGCYAGSSLSEEVGVGRYLAHQYLDEARVHFPLSMTLTLI